MTLASLTSTAIVRIVSAILYVLIDFHCSAASLAKRNSLAVQFAGSNSTPPNALEAAASDFVRFSSCANVLSCLVRCCCCMTASCAFRSGVDLFGHWSASCTGMREQTFNLDGDAYSLIVLDNRLVVFFDDCGRISIWFKGHWCA